jgi:hypothetical protein
MIDLDALSAAGLTNKRLKEIFTASPLKTGVDKGRGKKPAVTPPPSAPATANGDQSHSDILEFRKKPKHEDYEIREFFERTIQQKLQEGMDRCAATYRLHAAADLAYESTPINKTVLPFLKLAQGYITLQSCQDQIAALSKPLADELFKKDDSGKPFKVNLPRLFEISHNLVHSLVTRRVAAVSTPITQRFPFMRFESRSTTQVGRLRADMMTQRAEVMADQYGYRHDIVQTVRDVSLYTHQVEFKASAWDVEKQRLPRRKKKNDAADKVGAKEKQFDDVIVREGVSFVAPHPSRVYADADEAIAKINTDTGPSYIGYWDMTRLGTLRSNKAYYNLDNIRFDNAVFSYIANNRDYFSQYYRDQISQPPGASAATTGSTNATALAQNNDRKASLANYSTCSDTVSTTIAQHFEKIVPKDWGIGTYEHPVWIRFVVAGNTTVIYAEIVGSAPAVCYHFNESDGRTVSSSFAHAAIPYQDQISNLLTQLLEVQHQGFLRIYSLCTDGLAKEDIVKIEDGLKNHDYYKAKDIIIKYSLEKAQLMGQDPRMFTEKLKQTEIQTREKTDEIFNSILKLLAIAERLLFFSPQELGQVAPREITATEANMVATTTLGIRDFHAIGIDEGLDAKKRIIFESTMVFGSNTVELPVSERYPKEVVKAAGFEVVDDGVAEVDPSAPFTLTGNKDGLVHDYVFTSRDGFDRPSLGEEAKQLVTLMDVAARDATLNEIITTQQKVDIFNEVIRKVAGIDIKLRVPQGMDPNAPIAGNSARNQEILQTLTQAVQQLASTQAQDRAKSEAMAGAVAKLAESVKGMMLQIQPTLKGQVSPTTPVGSGAPVLTS